MSDETNHDYAVVTAATVELTFADGVTSRIELDTKECPIYLDLHAENDAVDKTADGGESRTLQPGVRRKIKLHLEGRGPQPGAKPTPEQILATPMEDNDAGADTIRGYLIALVEKIWREAEGFSGKRPFGNSSWQSDLYIPLAKAGYIVATFDEDGYLDEIAQDEEDKADDMIAEAIRALAVTQ